MSRTSWRSVSQTGCPLSRATPRIRPDARLLLAGQSQREHDAGQLVAQQSDAGPRFAT